MDTSIIFLDVDAEDRQSVQMRFPSAVFADGSTDEQTLINTCKDFAVISTFIHVPFPRSVLEQLPNLKLICTRSVGFDHIDIEACRERGILACNVPDYGSHVIAEHVFALLLTRTRNILEAKSRVESGRFDYHGLRGISLRGKTIGIMGTGKIGRRVAYIAHGFGMHILAYDIYQNQELVETCGVEYVSEHQLFEQSDIITLHVPATADTGHLLNESAFEHMKKGVIIVNTARGSLIDSQALLKNLDNGKVAYALLDVLEFEDNMKENEAVINHPRVIVTPHIAFYADDSMRNMYEDCFDSIIQWMEGKVPEHVVHPLKVVS